MPLESATMTTVIIKLTLNAFSFPLNSQNARAVACDVDFTGLFRSGRVFISFRSDSSSALCCHLIYDFMFPFLVDFIISYDFFLPPFYFHFIFRLTFAVSI